MSQPTTNADPYAALASELHAVADQIATLAGSGTAAPVWTSIQLWGGMTLGESKAGVPIADAIASALGLVCANRPRSGDSSTWDYIADASRGPLNVGVRCAIPRPADLEKERLCQDVAAEGVSDAA